MAPSKLEDCLRVTKVTPEYWRATFNDPPMNLLTPEMTLALWQLADDLEADEDVRVIVFDSNAPDYFIMHFDMIRGSEALKEPGKGWPLFIQRLVQMPVISIASIRGRARGVGSEFILSCDMRFASIEKAIIGQPEVGAGVIPGGSALEWLPSLVGRSRALEICAGSEDFDGKTAELYGYVNRAVPDDKLDEFVDAYARRIAGFNKFPLAQVKMIINNRASTPSISDIQHSQSVFTECTHRPDTQQRIKNLFAAGLQQDGPFERNLGKELAYIDSKDSGSKGITVSI
ncbi:enoyl- hydratase [Trichoderma arundinaceum]|uniref:Enoyl-hydratase n=1 Tax=Trichoderma arundinaceum TaxID=490622 RepID=A0A395NZD3_TRIAR|nr:enoyl- hydratase [Trichoderma arundinaceum]